MAEVTIHISPEFQGLIMAAKPDHVPLEEFIEFLMLIGVGEVAKTALEKLCREKAHE